MPETVLHHIISMCRNFLWTGDIRRQYSALVAWKTLCLPKSEGGLGLFDLKARNRSFLAKQLWNIHLKTDSIWIQWVHHYYVHTKSVWDIQAHSRSSPLWKVVLSVRDILTQQCGSPRESIQLLSSWSYGVNPFLAQAYHFFRPAAPTVPWHQVVWEDWSLPKYRFILWLAVLGKLRTRDRLQFLHIDPSCVFCRQEDESHQHLFFLCGWSCNLWSQVTSWLQIDEPMNSLPSALRGMHPKKRSHAARMRRVSLGIVIYLIWEERNRRVFERNSRSINTIFRRFQILFFTILHFHVKANSLPG